MEIQKSQLFADFFVSLLIKDWALALLLLQ